MVSICSIRYYMHRLAWLYVYGYFPEGLLDHKDRIRHHNWIANLRERGQQCNIRNVGIRKNNTSGITGVTWNKESERWKAYVIIIMGKMKYLGHYQDKMEAVAHRLAAEQCLDWENCDNSSPAYQFMYKLIDMP